MIKSTNRDLKGMKFIDGEIDSRQLKWNEWKKDVTGKCKSDTRATHADLCLDDVLSSVLQLQCL